MKALDDILIGFLIFFALERFVRLVSNAFVEPWALRRTGNKDKAEVWKLLVEFLMLISALFFVIRNQKILHKLNMS